ncbi:unnamed protein product [Clonostachys byssicola]|uniref:Uncharacterized protein n=1 Tax=Clonostachys byssicola TaxID=160290 RepID=A0A9N9U9P4_9HYPO|nr:unnamed protein product [Clonostachys byssicola]
MSFGLEWDLKKFIIDQEYVNSGTIILEHILCVTGTRRCAQATTVQEYFEQTWPGGYHPLISLLNKFLSSTQCASCDLELPDGTSLSITQGQSQCFIVVRGGFEFVAEIGEQLGWLASALRPSELPEGVLSCVPQISSIDLHGQSTYKGNITINASCRITFSMNRINDSNPLLPGFCWANMFRNPVVVAGYPIRHRDQGDTGLEIPLEAMAGLVQSNQVFSIDGNIMLKGFCSLLVVTAIITDTAMWHFLFNADGERISYCDTRLEGPEGMRIVTHKGLELKDLESRRHVVGWCSSVREFTGHPQAGFGVKRSILPHFPSSIVIDRLYVEGGFHVIGGISVSPGKRDKPLRLAKARGNLAKLEWIYSQALVLMDVDDRRAWLVDGASGLLHLVRASIEQNRNHPAYKSKWKFSGALKLEGDDCLGLGGDHGVTAVEILGNTENLNVQLYVDDVRPDASGQLVEVPYCLRDKVQEILPHLEALIDKQAEVAAQDGYWIRSPSKLLEKSLAGWDFWDIAGPAGPVQRRIYHLQASGHGWVDYIRSIKAVTIFGRGFGELLEPEKQKLCPNWMTVPKNKDYLGTSIATLKHIDASSNTQLVDQGSIATDIKWLSQATLFSPCACLDPNGAKPSNHHDPVQLLLPKGLNLHLDIPSTCLSITIGSIEHNGAVVFGHTPYRRPWPKSKNADDQADSESTEPPSSASNSTQPRVGHSDESGLFEMSSSSSRAQPTSASRPVTLKNPAKSKVKDRWSWLKKLSR